MPLHVIRFEAENFMNLKYVDITTSKFGHIIPITGRNGSGKTSADHALWAAIAGGEASRAIQQPIRDGEDHAFVRLDLGDYVVTQRWEKDGKRTLTVEAKDGARYSSPQKLLDELRGNRSFDPFRFLSLDSKAQVSTLLELLGDSLTIDPIELDAQRKGVFERRTDVNRKIKELEGQLAGYPSADPSLPAEEISARDVLDELTAARELNDRRDVERDKLAALEKRVEDAEEAFERAQQILKSAKAELADQMRAVATLPERIDLDPLTEKLENLDKVNQRIRAEQHRKAVAAELSDRKSEVAAYTLRLREIDKEKADGLADATKNLPYPGISLDESGVTLNGVPFSQASRGEQLRVSTALSMAFHPELRVLRIDNAEALDSDSLAIIDELAGEHEYQVWTFAVQNQAGTGIYFENGEVAA